ncbi:hypothetical protein NMY22_g6309 [Coprinellus aureogranulatus]|nr:hypothetical protein NMY22_g6309 [Coprinellus aureogranulatus]
MASTPEMTESDLATQTPSTPSSMGSYSPPMTPPNLHQNTIDPAAKWLVQKYGGTSVGKFAVKIARDIVSTYLDQHKLAIVCSARSGSTKALGTTSLLLKASAEALERPKKSSSKSSSNRVNGHAIASGAQTPASPGTGANTPNHFRGLFGRTYGYGSDGSHSPPSADSPNLRSRSSSSSGKNAGGLFGFTPLSGAATPGTPREALPAFHGTVDVIKEEHFKAAREHIQDAEILAELEDEIDSDCEWLRSFLYATKIIDEISLRSKDNIIGLGEKLACKLMAAILRDQGIDAEYVPLDDILPESLMTEDYDGKALGQDFYDTVARVIAERVQQCGCRVPVVTGFFGPVPGSLLSQIGRGYTDLCAALLAAGLEASELQIWKEVDGIFTADPRKVPTARLIPMISPDEAAELTYYGSEVVHPFVMEQAIRKKIPIRIKNVENPLGGGTVIHPDPDHIAPPSLIDPLVAMQSASAEASATTTVTGKTRTLSSSSSSSSSQVISATASVGDVYSFSDDPNRRRLPTAVTIKENIMVINVHSNRKSVSHGFLAGIFGTLDRFGVVVDLIATSEVHVTMAIADCLSQRIVERLLNELRKAGAVSVSRDMTILSLVGKQMRNMVGISGKMFTTLADGNVNIEMISQGASEINISCVIDARDAVKALNLIHQSCLMIKPEGTRGRVGPWLF